MTEITIQWNQENKTFDLAFPNDIPRPEIVRVLRQIAGKVEKGDYTED